VAYFKGKILQLKKEKRRLPNGRVMNVEIIVHPGATLIVPFLSKEKVILLRQYRPVIKQFLYEFPAGTIEKGETPFQCARREIVEETGFAARTLTRLGKIYPVPGYSTEIITIYKAEGLIQKKSCLEADEVIRTCIVSRAQMKKMFRKGQIKDSKTICALSLCGWI